MTLSFAPLLCFMVIGSFSDAVVAAQAFCEADKYQCADGLGCIPDVWKCDGWWDCYDGSDEGDCVCDSVREFQCASGGCISMMKNANWVCDCSDGSDENNGCIHGNCKEGSDFQCGNGYCLPSAWVCDGLPECYDKSDEVNCDCNFDTRFECGSGGCIDSTWVCDGWPDCYDWSDETNCNCNTSDEFQCTSGGCISASFECEGDRDCHDGSDEAHCCDQTFQFQCADGPCIPASYECNTRTDCADGSDEEGCRFLTERTTIPTVERTATELQVSTTGGVANVASKLSAGTIAGSAVGVLVVMLLLVVGVFLFIRYKRRGDSQQKQCDSKTAVDHITNQINQSYEPTTADSDVYHEVNEPTQEYAYAYARRPAAGIEGGEGSYAYADAYPGIRPTVPAAEASKEGWEENAAYASAGDEGLDDVNLHKKEEDPKDGWMDNTAYISSVDVDEDITKQKDKVGWNDNTIYAND